MDLSHPFHSLELIIISLVQGFRTPVLDEFFKYLDFFDRLEFFFILIPALWLGKEWKWGLRIFYIFFLSGLANHFLKEFFLSPRPFHLNPSLGIIQVNGYGFPSGAAQTVILLSGILLNHWNNPWKWCVAFFYVVFVSFSRIYLGLHFPTDILGGWIIGFFLWILFTYIRPLLETQLENLQARFLFLLSQTVPLLLFFCEGSVATLRISACAMGMGVGLWINHSYQWYLPPSKTKIEFALKTAVGSASLFSLHFLLKLIPFPQSPLALFFSFFLVGLWIAAGAFFLCRKLFSSALLTHENA